MSESLEELKRKSVLAHRILTMMGSMTEIVGHVFVRIPDTNEMLARCRNDSDWSPGFVGDEALHRVDLDGNPTEELGDWLPPPERFIGTEILKARPEVGCVIHGHPRFQNLCGMTGIEIRPIYNSAVATGMGVALGGIPVYPRCILIASPEASQAVMAVMGAKDACLLKAHGNVVTGRTVEEATVKAIALENLAELCWQVAQAGRQAPDILWEDVEEFLSPAQPAARQVRRQGGAVWIWRYYLKVLEEGGRLHAGV